MVSYTKNKVKLNTLKIVLHMQSSSSLIIESEKLEISRLKRMFFLLLLPMVGRSPVFIIQIDGKRRVSKIIL